MVSNSLPSDCILFKKTEGAYEMAGVPGCCWTFR
jgi:hypothetical protein